MKNKFSVGDKVRVIKQMPEAIKNGAYDNCLTGYKSKGEVGIIIEIEEGAYRVKYQDDWFWASDRYLEKVSKVGRPKKRIAKMPKGEINPKVKTSRVVEEFISAVSFDPQKAYTNIIEWLYGQGDFSRGPEELCEVRKGFIQMLKKELHIEE